MLAPAHSRHLVLSASGCEVPGHRGWERFHKAPYVVWQVEALSNSGSAPLEPLTLGKVPPQPPLPSCEDSVGQWCHHFTPEDTAGWVPACGPRCPLGWGWLRCPGPGCVSRLSVARIGGGVGDSAHRGPCGDGAGDSRGPSASHLFSPPSLTPCSRRQQDCVRLSGGPDVSGAVAPYGQGHIQDLGRCPPRASPASALTCVPWHIPVILSLCNKGIGNWLFNFHFLVKRPQEEGDRWA